MFTVVPILAVLKPLTELMDSYKAQHTLQAT